MRLYDTEGKLVSVRINRSDYELREKSRSNIQKEIGCLLKKRFPLCTILEEWPIPGKTGMVFDFVILPEKIVVEVQGEQHNKFVKHFHGDLEGFKRHKQRDQNKRDWCNINRFTLIEIEKSEEFNDLFGEKHAK